MAFWKSKRGLIFLTMSVAIALLSESANAFKDYGIDMGSCAPTSGWQSIKESTNPRGFWLDLSVELGMDLEEWGDDELACGHVDRRNLDWCVLTRRNMLQALRKCEATADYMFRKHRGS